MNSEAIKEILDTLFSNLEKLETQTEAMAQFIKEKTKVTDEQLAPYFEKAGNASNVRWRAARVRIEYLLSAAEMEESRDKEKKAEHAKNAEQPANSEKDGKKSKTPSGMEQAVASDPENVAKENKPVAQKEAKAGKQQTESTDGVHANSRSAEVTSGISTPTESQPEAADQAKEANADSAKQTREGQDQAKRSGDQEAA